ncbi:hypothetical protein [Enterococcus hulanensis]|uniref:hypothetical protein n=1 Tax=Enterococcus hulanensis TaxID=2559929 RepID=UPI001BB1FB6D|nr:hypothetical protein [Enterococcus hulanensis]
MNADLPGPQLKEACELLTQLDIFEKDGVKLFDTVVTGRIVTTYDREVFDKEKEPKAAAPAKSPLTPTGTMLAQKLRDSAETGNNPLSLRIQSPQIGEKHTIDGQKHPVELPTAAKSALPMAEEPAQVQSAMPAKDLKSTLRKKDYEREKERLAENSGAPPNQRSQQEIGHLKRLIARIWGKQKDGDDDSS